MPPQSLSAPATAGRRDGRKPQETAASLPAALTANWKSFENSGNGSDQQIDVRTVDREAKLVKLRDIVRRDFDVRDEPLEFAAAVNSHLEIRLHRRQLSAVALTFFEFAAGLRPGDQLRQVHARVAQLDRCSLCDAPHTSYYPVAVPIVRMVRELVPIDPNRKADDLNVR